MTDINEIKTQIKKRRVFIDNIAYVNHIKDEYLTEFWYYIDKLIEAEIELDRIENE